MEGRGENDCDRKGPSGLCLQVDHNPNLYLKLNNTGSTQTHAILSMASINPTPNLTISPAMQLH